MDSLAWVVGVARRLYDASVGGVVVEREPVVGEFDTVVGRLRRRDDGAPTVEVKIARNRRRGGVCNVDRQTVGKRPRVERPRVDAVLGRELVVDERDVLERNGASAQVADGFEDGASVVT